MVFSQIQTILIVVPCFAQLASVVSDPVADFIALDLRYSNRVGSIEEIYVVKADIGGSTEPEIFITHQNMYVDRSGYWWEVYRPVRGGYVRVQQPVTNSSGDVVGSKSGVRFRTDAFHVGRIEDVEGTELFSYSPGGGQTGSFIGVWMEDGALVTRKVRELKTGPRGEDLDLYNQLFGTERGVMVKAKVEDLATEEQRMALIGGTVDSGQPAGFVSRTPEEPDTGREDSAVSAQEAARTPDPPSLLAALDEEADEPTATVETAPSEGPQGSGWPGGMLVVSIGALAFLLAFAGYQVFSKKGRAAQ